MRFSGSVTEEENEFGGTEQISNLAEVWRNGPLRWTRNGKKVGIRRKRGGTTPSGVAVVSFRSVSTLGGKRVRNECELLCSGGNHILSGIYSNPTITMLSIPRYQRYLNHQNMSNKTCVRSVGCQKWDEDAEWKSTKARGAMDLDYKMQRREKTLGFWLCSGRIWK